MFMPHCLKIQRFRIGCSRYEERWQSITEYFVKKCGFCVANKIYKISAEGKEIFLLTRIYSAKIIYL
jgi:hypothetical protein